MKHLSRLFGTAFALTALTQTALAADMSNCEVAVTKVVKAEDGSGEMHINSFRPAQGFIESVQDESPEHLTQIDGHKIDVLFCTRNDVIPAGSDYPFLATGIPLSLSQDFLETETDSLTVKWIEGRFKYAYRGHPLSGDALVTLKARLAEFSERGLNASALDAAEAEREDEAEVEANVMAELETDLADELETNPAVESSEAQETDVEPQDILILDLDKSDPTEAINTNAASAEDSLALDEIKATEADVIKTDETRATEATKLNIQTKIETEE